MLRSIRGNQENILPLSPSYNNNLNNNRTTTSSDILERGYEITNSCFIDHQRNIAYDPIQNPRPQILKTEQGPTSSTSWKQECFSQWPKIATDDTLNDEGLKKLNKGLTWFQYCGAVLEEYKSKHK